MSNSSIHYSHIHKIPSMNQEPFTYDPRFLDVYAGAIIKDPITAIVELVANCWDAYATEVKIFWPDSSENQYFKIEDNGCGMTESEFKTRWSTFSYNRLIAQGKQVLPPPGTHGLPRDVFGKNGKGRFASFCFSDQYRITSCKDGKGFTYLVSRSLENPFILQKINTFDTGKNEHGTTIEGYKEIRAIPLSGELAREEIGSRFLTNPDFVVYLNNIKITFDDISDKISEDILSIESYGTVRIIQIDPKKSHKNTYQHGIAWWVQNRAVGKCSWHGSDFTKILDGRTSEAKRFTFIVQANFLNDYGAVTEDWKWFNEENEVWIKTRDKVQEYIVKLIDQSQQEGRKDKRETVYRNVASRINNLSPISKKRVAEFIEEVIDKCPSFTEKDITNLATILVKLESSTSKYGILELLHKCQPNDYDDLHKILCDWTINSAKIVLDEIQNRLKLIQEIRNAIQCKGVDEVHELQPLFEKGLWMFGAQFESIEFTSNKGMTKVIRELFGLREEKGSRNRPDFVVLPNNKGSVSLFSRESYDEETGIVNGSSQVVIIDLKTTGLKIGDEEKLQIWKYVKELRNKGCIDNNTKIYGFILGDYIEPAENQPRTEGENVKIIPLLYMSILANAEKRLFNLQLRIKDDPFLKEVEHDIEKFLEPIPVTQPELNLG